MMGAWNLEEPIKKKHTKKNYSSVSYGFVVICSYLKAYGVLLFDGVSLIPCGVWPDQHIRFAPDPNIRSVMSSFLIKMTLIKFLKRKMQKHKLLQRGRTHITGDDYCNFRIH